MAHAAHNKISTFPDRPVLERAKRLAERVVATMRAQGYRDIEYILTDSQLKVVASASEKMPQTLYLNVPHAVLHPKAR